MTSPKKSPPKNSGASAPRRLLGKVTGPFGIKGEVRIWLHDPESDYLFQPRRVYLIAPNGQERTVELCARCGGGPRILASIQGVSDRDAARALMGCTIELEAHLLPALEAGEYWIRDILGKTVWNEQGQELGLLVEVHQAGPIDVWEIRSPKATWYVPALKQNVLEVSEQGIRVQNAQLLPQGEPPAPEKESGD